MSEQTKTMRIIRFTAGALPEDEVIRTDAPNEVIREQMHINGHNELNGVTIEPYSFIESKGYTVELLGSIFNGLELPEDDIDEEFDWYDYE